MLKQVQHDNEARVRCGKKVEKYEMLKRVQHDSLVWVQWGNLVCGGSLAWVWRGKKKRCLKQVRRDSVV